MPNMSADDQYFLDFLSNIPDQVTSYTRYAISSIDESFDSAAASVRHTLESTTWLPSSLRPKPPPPPPPRLPPLTVHPTSLYCYARSWFSQHRAFSAAFVAFVGTGTILLWRQKKAYKRKRRAKRASDGSRREVVVVMGSVDDTITRAVILDLERRGFIVYVIASHPAEEEMVKSIGKTDILPLHLDVTNPFDVQNTISNFSRLFSETSSPSSPAPSSSSAQQSPQRSLIFTSLLLMPSVSATPAPLETLDPSHLSDALNAYVLATVTTAQAFIRPIISHNARVLLLTPIITASLRPPFHGVENTVLAALDGFSSSLRAEMQTLGINVCHIKMGNFDTASIRAGSNATTSGAGTLALTRSARAELLSWPEWVRTSYARNFVAVTDDADFPLQRRRSKGSSLRELNNTVFDAISNEKTLPAVWRVGRGSWIYPLIGTWVPRGLVWWMLGLKQAHPDNSTSGPDVSLHTAGSNGDGYSSEAWQKV